MLKGGIPEWRYFNYPISGGEKLQKIKVSTLPPLEFQEILNSRDDLFLLDVRSLSRESLARGKTVFHFDNSLFSGKYIVNTRHCPLVYLKDNAQLIPKDKKILISDWLMKQSPSAAKFLISEGYDVLGILKGGTARWQAEGLPLLPEDDAWHEGQSCE